MLANTLVPSSGIVMHNRNVVYADAKVTSALAPPGAVGDDSDRTYIAGSIQLRTAGNIVRDKYMIGFWCVALVECLIPCFPRLNS